MAFTALRNNNRVAHSMNRCYRWRWEILAPLAGVCSTLAFAPYNYSYLLVFALATVFLSWLNCSPARAALRGFFYGLGLFGSGISWVYISLHDYGGAPVFGAVLLTLAIICFWSLGPTLVAYLTLKLFAKKPKNRVIWALPFSWIFIEYLRGYWFLNGFPWLQLAYSQLQTPLAGYVPLLGAYGAGFLLALTAAVFVAGYRKQIRYQNMALFVLLVWGGGLALQSIEWTEKRGDAIRVALIQGNVAQDQKWLPQNRLKTLTDYQQLTEQNWDADIVLWPESAIPAYWHQVHDNYLVPLAAKAKIHNTDIVLGLPSLGKQNTHFNTVLALGETTGRYHKNHLLPFGEYLPLQPLSGFILSLLNVQLGDFSSGGPDQDLLQAGGYRFATSICYEDAFPKAVLPTLPEAAFLVNLTNDAWFGDSIEPHQHLQLAQMRALETGRYMLRVTNTGVTAIVAPDGSISNKIPSFQQRVLRGEIFPMGGMTFYARWGDYIILLVLAALFLPLVFWRGKTQP